MNRASFLAPAKSAFAGMLSFCPGWVVLRWVQRPSFKAADVSSQQLAPHLLLRSAVTSLAFPFLSFFLQECRYLSCRYRTHLWKNQAQTVLSHLYVSLWQHQLPFMAPGRQAPRFWSCSKELPIPTDPPLDKYKKGVDTLSALLKEGQPKEQKHQGFYY